MSTEVDTAPDVRPDAQKDENKSLLPADKPRRIIKRVNFQETDGTIKATTDEGPPITRERPKSQQSPIPRASHPSLKPSRRREFKILHGFLVALFLWIAYVHIIGIYLFTRGFLLTRTVLASNSTCSLPPVDGTKPENEKDGCWFPKKFDRAVIVIVDAWRYDFAVPYAESQGVKPYHNAFTTPYKIATEQPQNAFLVPFIADPPTTTLQRLKGLTTGTLPTFVDAGSNFAGTAILEDNLIIQLKNQGKKLALLGDDTWTALFPGYFDIQHDYESLNVWDLHTVDNGVLEHMFPLLHSENMTKWDIMIGHFLGVDHAGHRYGPDHPAMNAKLLQMDSFLQDLIDKVDDDTLVVVMGDHGMDPKGDHGGESQLELESTLWMYSKKGIFGRNPEYSQLPPKDAKERSVAQIDLVPTLSLLLGLPIPFNNLGSPIEEAFLGPESDDWEALARATRLTASQIERYQKEYTEVKKSEVDLESQSSRYLDEANTRWKTMSSLSSKDNEGWQHLYRGYLDYQRENLNICKKLWASFDLVSMLAGVIVLIMSVLALLIYSKGLSGDTSEVSGTIFARVMIGGLAGAVGLWSTSHLALVDLSSTNQSLFGSAIGSMIGFFVSTFELRDRLTNVLPKSIFGILSLVFTVSQAAMFAANSWTIWEDRILTLFLGTFGFFALISSLRQTSIVARTLGTYHSAIFIILTKLASLSRLCREEQMPYCESTFYASATSSVSSPYTLAILFFIALVFPFVVQSFYMSTKSYEGSAITYIGSILRVGLVVVATYWTLDSADNGEWINIEPEKLKWTKMTLSRIVLVAGLLVGNLGFIWTKLCLNVQIVVEETKEEQVVRLATSGKSTNSSSKPSTTAGNNIILLGYSNLHGSRYFLLVITWYLSLTLLQKPMGGASMCILLYQILTLLEIIDYNNLSNSSIGPIVLGLLGSSHFFSTGHQATLTSIQWETAFIPVDRIVYPWSPLVVLGNTFGPQMLAAIAVPAVVLWKQSPKQTGLLGKVAKACATHLLYYAVIGTATTMWAGHLRRHLMLYRIFSPRFLLGGSVLVVVDVVMALVAIVAVRWNFLSVGEVFGIC